MKTLSAMALAAAMLAMICTPAVAGSSYPSRDWEIKDLLAAESLLDGICRGSVREQFEKVCAARNIADATLNSLGWCYSEPGWIGAQNHWHKCKPDAEEKKAGEAHLDRLRGRQRAQEVAEIIGQRMKLKTDRVRGERAT
jgi:hypothetical protein